MSDMYIRVVNGVVEGFPVMAENLSQLLGQQVTDSSALSLNYLPIDDTPPVLEYNQTHNYGGWTQKEDGTFSIDWIIVTSEQSELMDKWIRGKRDSLLAFSDWTQVLDCALSKTDKDAWVEFRKNLRDLPKTYINAKSESEIIWPRFPGQPDDPVFVDPATLNM